MPTNLADDALIALAPHCRVVRTPPNEFYLITHVDELRLTGGQLRHRPALPERLFPARLCGRAGSWRRRLESEQSLVLRRRSRGVRWDLPDQPDVLRIWTRGEWASRGT